jgi:precorrin-3B C17-methyltransferase
MDSNNNGSCRSGTLSIVGTGPGDKDYIIPAAENVIAAADVVIGYKTYLDLIKPIISGKEVVSSQMMQEVDRVKKGLQLAESGKSVALVSGGDPGIYAMAGLAFEVARAKNSTVDIKVVAGIAALNSCAERLGAPLMHDFATISLSDLLTPWEVIERRLHAVAEADFVIVIYNPRSRKRDWQLGRAMEIIAGYRSPDTPVGSVRGATRENEVVDLTMLDRFEPDSVDMQTTIIIGNSNTFSWHGKMVTPRGYQDKYQLA